MPLRLVVDSSADIDPERAATHNITVVPLTISFGEETFRDYVDLDPDTFYTRMAQTSALPQTSMPSTVAFEEAYRHLIAQGATSILSLHVSEKFSGTINAARLAAKALADESRVPIRIIDSQTVSAAIGLPVLRAAAMLDAGASETALVTYLTDAWQRGKTYILLDTLSNLERGGRIGHAQALVGTLLQIKPILTIQDGLVTPLERVRTRAKALTRLGEVLQTLKPIADLSIASSDPTVYQELATIARTAYAGDITSFTFGPVVGTYAGPRAGGIFALPEAK